MSGKVTIMGATALNITIGDQTYGYDVSSSKVSNADLVNIREILLKTFKDFLVSGTTLKTIGNNPYADVFTPIRSLNNYTGTSKSGIDFKKVRQLILKVCEKWWKSSDKTNRYFPPGLNKSSTRKGGSFDATAEVEQSILTLQEIMNKMKK